MCGFVLGYSIFKASPGMAMEKDFNNGRSYYSGPWGIPFTEHRLVESRGPSTKDKVKKSKVKLSP
jgi:hypothetical protein